MLYDLPVSPAIVLVGPTDRQRWVELGEDPAGRHTLVIGDPTGLHGPLTRALGQAYARAQGTLSGEEHRGHTPVPHLPAREPRPVVDPVTLPHTGIRVPDANLRVSSLRELPAPDGVAHTATVRLCRTPVGTLHNEGMGGPTSYHPAAGSPFGYRQLANFVAASRTADDQPLTEEDLLEELITDSKHVASATRAGHSPVRLRAPLGEGDGFADTYYTAYRDTAAKVTTPAQREALVAELPRRAVVEGAGWQLWTGQWWEDLTAPLQRDQGEEVAP